MLAFSWASKERDTEGDKHARSPLHHRVPARDAVWNGFRHSRRGCRKEPAVLPDRQRVLLLRETENLLPVPVSRPHQTRPESDLTKMTRFKREALAANLLSAGKKTGMPAIVGRQLADGDYVLMNRQVRSVPSFVCRRLFFDKRFR